MGLNCDRNREPSDTSPEPTLRIDPAMNDGAGLRRGRTVLPLRPTDGDLLCDAPGGRSNLPVETSEPRLLG